MTAVFIYSKDSRIKVLDNNTAIERHNELIKSGWTHTATLDPCLYIEHLYKCRYPKKELKQLK